jgi:hypothetical protein
VSSAGRAKRDREKAKQERAALKRAKRQDAAASADSPDAADEADGARVTGPPASQEQVLAQLATLHQRFDDGALDFEDFEAAKNELMSRLNV